MVGFYINVDAGNNPLSLKMFKMSVAMSLIKDRKSPRTSRGRPSTYVEKTFIAKRKRVRAAPIPNTSIRTDKQIAMTIFRVSLKKKKKGAMSKA